MHVIPEKTKKRKERSKNLSINSDDSDDKERKMGRKSKKLKIRSEMKKTKSESKHIKGDKIQNYDLKIHVNDEVIHKNFEVNLTKKTTTTKNLKRTKKRNSAKNMDEEEDGKDYIWEIDRDWKLPYYRRQKYKKPKQKTDLEVMGLENYRKREGYEGELLVHFKDGRRDWAPACACKTDAKAKMYNDALKRFNLTNEQLEYGLSKKQIVTIEQKGKDEHFE